MFNIAADCNNIGCQSVTCTVGPVDMGIGHPFNCVTNNGVKLPPVRSITPVHVLSLFSIVVLISVYAERFTAESVQYWGTANVTAIDSK